MAAASHKIERRDGATVLAFAGRIDLSNAKAVRRVVIDALAKPGDLHIDLTDTTYVDSSGIAHFVEGYRRARRAGKRLAIIGANTQVRRVLQISRLESVLMAG